MSKIRFGTGGWRDLIGDQFTRYNIERIGQAIANMLIEDNKTDKPILIGYDRRFLSDKASIWLSQVFAANNIKTQLLKRSSPTPLIMHSVKREKTYLGLEVTASHNPPEYNGIKIIVEEGRDAPVEVTERVEALANSDSLIVKTLNIKEGLDGGLIEYIKNPFNPYIDDIIDKLDMASIRERGLRIAFDPMHGSGTYPLLVILNTARCTIDLINSNKDAYFDGSYPTPNEETLEDLKMKVIKDKYDLGIAFDGDGDRLGIIDPTGVYISSNAVLLMLYYYLHEIKGWKGGVVRNISTTHTLDLMAKDFKEECYEVPVGFKWVSAAIDKNNAVLGGESSGGLTVRGHIFGKDSIYAASLFVEMLSVMKMTPLEIISKIEDKYGKTYFEELSIQFEKERKEYISTLLIKDKLLPSFKDEIEKISYMDGVKVYFSNNDFVICRFSGTEPVLRIMSEARSDEKAKEYITIFKSFVDSL